MRPGIRSEVSRESREKRTDKKLASKGHRRDQQETEKKTQTKSQQTEETNKRQPPHKTLLSRLLRKRGSPISGEIQPRHEDKGKDNGCDTQRNKNAEGGKGDNNQMK